VELLAEKMSPDLLVLREKSDFSERDMKMLLDKLCSRNMQNTDGKWQAVW